MARKTRSRRQHADARAGREEKAGEASGKDAVVSLPPHLIDAILCYLSPLESARVAAVCRSWAGIASRRLSDPPPHLFAFRSTATRRRGEVIAVPLGDEPPPAAASSRHGGARATPAHRALNRVTRKTACLGATASSRLVLANSRRTVLFNPVTGSSRRISKVPGMSDGGCYYDAHPMPVVPLGGDSFFHAGRNEVGVRLAEEDDDELKMKTKRLDNADTLRMAVLCGGSLYALDTYGFVFKFELPELEVTELEAPSLRHTCHHVDLTSGELDKGYLVEAGGEVLFVWPLYTTRRVRGERDLLDPEIFFSDSDEEEEDDDYFFDEVTTLSGFEVYRLDMEEMRWVEEAQLAGDVALFVSRRSSFSVPAASEKGCVSNCVYFVCDEGAGNTWGAFSLEERTMLFEHAIGEASYKERLWFYPSAKEQGQEDFDRRLDEIGYI